MALIFSSDFDDLPANPAQRWVKLRDLVEKRLGNIADTQEGVSDGDLIEYCAILSSATEELALGKLPLVGSTSIRDDFASFRSEVIALATRLSLRSSTASKSLSVALTKSTRAKIITQIEKLRKLAAESELSSGHKKRLEKKLDELSTLVIAPRTDITKVALILAIVGSGLVQGTSFLADIPGAIGTITALIGVDKEAEEEQRLLETEKEPLGLPAPESRSDDSGEIPF